jgi:type IV secretory pathway TrbF-like protein
MLRAPFPPPPPPSGDTELDAARMAAYRSANAKAARESRIIGIGAGIVVVAIVGGIFFAASRSEKPSVVPLFEAGETVKMKLDGRVGMVLRSYCYSRPACDYEVRFSAANLLTDVHLIAADGAVVSGAYSDVYVREFEMEAAP